MIYSRDVWHGVGVPPNYLPGILYFPVWDRLYSFLVTLVLKCHLWRRKLKLSTFHEWNKLGVPVLSVRYVIYKNNAPDNCTIFDDLFVICTWQNQYFQKSTHFLKILRNYPLGSQIIQNKPGLRKHANNNCPLHLLDQKPNWNKLQNMSAHS